MSSTSFDSEEFRRAHERRRLPRLRLPSLAYVDVDADNGGILLNLSETGLALQAVAPFSGLTRVALRIQPPKPRKRLDLQAEITWLSESKKEAGLQFLELADNTRVEIANWISAEGGARGSRATSDSAAPQTTQVSTAQFPEEAAALRRKWSRSLESSASPDAPPNQKAPSQLPSPPIASGRFEPHTAAILREKSVDIPAQNPIANNEKIYAPTSSPVERPADSVVLVEKVSPSAPSPSPELPHPEAAPPRRRKWSFLLENSPSQDAPAIQKMPNEIPRPSVGSKYLERLTDAILGAKSVDVPSQNPIATNETIHAHASSPTEQPVDEIVSSGKIPTATPSPSLGLPPTAAEAAATASALQPPPAAITVPAVQPPSGAVAEFVAMRDEAPNTLIPETSEEFPRTRERRRIPRQRICALAYLDIGSDNGGMVLDLTESGLALQAFNPLIEQTRLNLRIQPPKSRKRIAATAEIAWLSESKTEAGLKFLELSEDARTEIADWLSTETSAAEPPPVHDTAPCERSQVPSGPTAPPIPEKRYRIWEEWFPLFGDLNPQESAARNDSSGELLRTSTGSDDFAWQPGSARSQDFSDEPENAPETYQQASQRRANNVTEAAVSSSAMSESVPDAPNSPLKSPAALAVAPRPFLSERSRKWETIAALCACVALVFLLLGMAISRGLFRDHPEKLSAEDHANDSGAPSPASATDTSPVTHDASSSRTASPSESVASSTRHADSASLSRASHTEIHNKHNREIPRAQLSGEETDSSGVMPPSTSVPSPETAKSDSQNTAVPSLPVWSVQAAGIRPPAAIPPAIKPEPPRATERRSDCYLLYRVEPLYPREAKAQSIEGTVTLRLLVGTDGRVRSSRELSGPDLLVPAALAAVREWRFIPALLNGQPVDTEKDVSIEFQLSR
jgi:TonB family protein